MEQAPCYVVSDWKIVFSHYQRNMDSRCDMEEKKDEEDSRMNEGEAEVAISHAKRLVNSGVQSSDIEIINPYAVQVVLPKMMKKMTRYRTSKSQQLVAFRVGKRKQLSFQWLGNSKKEVGFLSDWRKMNVAVT